MKGFGKMRWSRGKSDDVVGKEGVVGFNVAIEYWALRGNVSYYADYALCRSLDAVLDAGGYIAYICVRGQRCLMSLRTQFP
jgi:hypothetical protein